MIFHDNTLYNVDMQIYPSVLETDIEVFKKRLTEFVPIFLHIQIDIADGKLVDNRTIQIEDVVDQVTRLRLVDAKAVAGKQGYSGQARNTFEIHLMVEDWQKEMSSLFQLAKSIQITRVFVHASVFHTPYSILNTQFEWGLVLNSEDTVDDYWEALQPFPIVQIMTVQPGRQGNPFLPESLEKISQLRQKGYLGKIILDGGINEETLPQILSRSYWPDAVCPGSYFHKEPSAGFKKLQEIVEQYKK